MDRCGDSDRSGIASLRRMSEVDTCAPGPASEFGPWTSKAPKPTQRREQSCRQRDNISVLLHEQLRRFDAIPLPQSAHLPEALAQFSDEELGLLKRGEVTAFRNLVPVEKVRIGLIAPHLWRCEKVAFEEAHRDGHV